MVSEPRYIELPENFRPDFGWISSAIEVLVDVAPYIHGGSEDIRWCKFTRVAPGSASVYPVKAEVPGRGQGQWKFSEVRRWRAERSVFIGLLEAHHHGGGELPHGLAVSWLERAIDQGGS
jgi:hypothetical protein